MQPRTALGQVPGHGSPSSVSRCFRLSREATASALDAMPAQHRCSPRLAGLWHAWRAGARAQIHWRPWQLQGRCTGATCTQWARAPALQMSCTHDRSQQVLSIRPSRMAVQHSTGRPQGTPSGCRRTRLAKHRTCGRAAQWSEKQPGRLGKHMQNTQQGSLGARTVQARSYPEGQSRACLLAGRAHDSLCRWPCDMHSARLRTVCGPPAPWPSSCCRRLPAPCAAYASRPAPAALAWPPARPCAARRSSSAAAAAAARGKVAGDAGAHLSCASASLPFRACLAFKSATLNTCGHPRHGPPIRRQAACSRRQPRTLTRP